MNKFGIMVVRIINASLKDKISYFDSIKVRDNLEVLNINYLNIVKIIVLYQDWFDKDCLVGREYWVDSDIDISSCSFLDYFTY